MLGRDKLGEPLDRRPCWRLSVILAVFPTLPSDKAWLSGPHRLQCAHSCGRCVSAPWVNLIICVCRVVHGGYRCLAPSRPRIYTIASRDPYLCRRAGDERKCSGGGTNLRRRSRRHKSQELKVSKAAETDAVIPPRGCSQFDLNLFIT